MRKRETMDERLERARLEKGLSYADIRRNILRDCRKELAESTIRNLCKDVNPNPGLKTVELVALGLGIPPLEVLALGLDEPPEETEAFLKSRFAAVWQVYLKLPPSKRPFFDEYVDMVLERMNQTIDG